MRRTMTGLFAAALALGVFIAVPGFAHHPDEHPQDKHGESQSVVHDCENMNEEKVGEVRYDGPEWMWPPNHKYRDLTVEAVGNNGDETVTLVTEGTHDEYVNGDEMNGAGNTADDVWEPMAEDGPNTNGYATTSHEVRAERSGRGVGRTYTISYQAEFDETVCTGEFKITVPHSMGNSANVKKNHNPNH